MYLSALFTWSVASRINGCLEIRLKPFPTYFPLSLALNWNNSHSAHKNEHGSKSVWSGGHFLVSKACSFSLCWFSVIKVIAAKFSRFNPVRLDFCSLDVVEGSLVWGMCYDIHLELCNPSSSFVKGHKLLEEIIISIFCPSVKLKEIKITSVSFFWPCCIWKHPWLVILHSTV